MKLLIETPF